ncbi:MAG: DUF6989 domain-containing protein [Actinomycetes bacterium]
MGLTRTERDLALLHVALLAAAAVVLAPGGPRGWRLVGLVVGYQVALLALAWWRADRDLVRLWWFAASFSVWMLLPDAVLHRALGILRFPPDGAPDMLGVTIAMAGMWAVPAVVVVTVARGVEERRGRSAAGVAAGLVGLVVFVAAEAVLPRLGVWVPTAVTTLGTVALYIVPAEVLLSVVLHDAAGALATRRPAAVAGGTALVMLLYTGAACVSYLVVEQVLLA